MRGVPNENNGWNLQRVMAGDRVNAIGSNVVFDLLILCMLVRLQFIGAPVAARPRAFVCQRNVL